MADRGRLKAAVYVQDPTTREELILLPGDCPDPEVAVLITTPDAWEEPPDDCDEPGRGCRGGEIRAAREQGRRPGGDSRRGQGEEVPAKAGRGPFGVPSRRDHLEAARHPEQPGGGPHRAEGVRVDEFQRSLLLA
ncbi:hypothetical protein [Streptomyces sp. 6N106]|uniref:hypothetical protein n=1 Tax=Streptomyces sp. 6N106 TaxID=3457418 RepID=UPI003FD63F29